MNLKVPDVKVPIIEKYYKNFGRLIELQEGEVVYHNIKVIVQDIAVNIGLNKRGQRTRLNTQILGLIKDHTNGRMLVLDDGGDDAVNFMRSVVNSHRSLSQTPQTEDSRLELWDYCVLAALFFIFLTIVIY